MKNSLLILSLITNIVFASSPDIVLPDTIKTSKDVSSDNSISYWRSDLKAVATTDIEAYYSTSSVSVLIGGDLKQVAFPSYKEMTGFPTPEVEHLRPRGRNTILGWTKDGLLALSIWRTPLPSFSSKDPLYHVVYLQVSPTGMKTVRRYHEHGYWSQGDWIKLTSKRTNNVEN